MSVQYLEKPDQSKLAYIYSEGTDKSLPIVMFLAGFRSDMEGTKALYLEEQCKKRGQGFIRFDYSGHGISEGKFEDGTIGQWKDDALAIFDLVLDQNPDSKILPVGSSMGGWISLLLADARKGHLAGLVGLAAAPDFTRHMLESLTIEQQEMMDQQGYAEIPNDYSDEPYTMTARLLREGNDNLFLAAQHDFPFSVTLIQGMKDLDVPWQTTDIIKSVIDGTVNIILREEGDHRLSADEDLKILDQAVRDLSAFTG